MPDSEDWPKPGHAPPVGQALLDFRRTPVAQAPGAVEADETLEPRHVTVLGARGIVLDAQHLPHLVEPTRGLRPRMPPFSIPEIQRRPAGGQGRERFPVGSYHVFQ